MKCYDRVEGKIGTVFENLGYFISNHPWKIIFVAVMVNGLLGIGILKLETDIDVGRVYTPMNSQAVKDEEVLQEIQGDHGLQFPMVYQKLLFDLSHQNNWSL